jgi:hypothetical protein
MEESLMSENKPNSKRLLGFLVSPVVLIRLSSILVVLLMVGHTSAYPWTSIHGLQETRLVDLMKSVEFEFLGERSTYWSLYFGWGLLISVLLLTLAIILWLLSDLARLAPRRLASLLEPSPRAAWPARISLFVFSIDRRFYFFRLSA